MPIASTTQARKIDTKLAHVMQRLEQIDTRDPDLLNIKSALLSKLPIILLILKNYLKNIKAVKLK